MLRKKSSTHRAPVRSIYKMAAGLLTVVLTFLVSGCDNQLTGILNPKGIIAYEERILLFDSLALMMIVVIPVVIMSFAFLYRYHESHKYPNYKPNWSHSTVLESLWWGIPCVIIVVMGIMSYRATHKLDPYRKIDGVPVSMRIEVVALPWKWLFIYPEHNIATVNFLEIPKGKQVEFWLTSDNVPMSAFFIPQLGSQIYTMAGMRTKLHLLATHEGTFRGLNAQYNGDGFSDMHFPVKVVSDDEMKQWISQVQQSASPLDEAHYDALKQPTIAHQEEYFSGVKPELFKEIIAYYMGHGHDASQIKFH